MDEFEKTASSMRMASVGTMYHSVTPQTAVEIYNQKARLQNKPEIYYLNKDLYAQETQRPFQTDPEQFRGMAEAMSDSSLNVIASGYYDESINRERTLSYIRSKREMGPIDALVNDYKLQARSLDLAAAYADLGTARDENDAEDEVEAIQKIQQLENEIGSFRPMEDGGIRNTTISIAASMTRVAPKLIAESIAFALLTKATVASGGTATPATAPAMAVTGGRIANRARLIWNSARTAKNLNRLRNAAGALTVYMDTKKVEQGATYRELDTLYPNLPEAKKQEIAETVGMINGALETSGYFFGGMAIVRRALLDKIATGGITKATVRNPTFMRALIKRSGQLARFGAEGEIEGIQELIQNSVQEAALDQAERIAAGNGDTEMEFSGRALVLDTYEQLQGLTSRTYDSITNGTPLNMEDAANLRMVQEVAAGSWILGGGSNAISGGVSYGLQRRRAAAAKAGVNPSVLGRVSGVTQFLKPRWNTKNETNAQTVAGAMEQQNLMSKMMTEKENSKLFEASPQAYTDINKKMSEAGTIPEAAYLDVQTAREVIEHANSDPAIQQKVADLQLIERLQDADKEGGLIKIPLEVFEPIVIDPKDTKLYQQLNGKVTFDPDVATQSEAAEILEARRKQTNVPEGDVFGYVYDTLRSGTQQSKAEANINAYIAEQLFERIATFETEQRDSKALLKELRFQIQTEQNRRAAEESGKRLTPNKRGIFDKNGITLDGQRFNAKQESVKLAGLNTETTPNQLWAENAGLFDAAQSAPIIVFQAKNGQMTVVDGAQRVELARSQNIESIDNAIVLKESDGNTIDMARTFAELANAQEQKVTTGEALAENFAGAFEANPEIGNLIRLGQSANATTFAHEMSHLFLNQMIESHNRGTLTEYWSKKLDSIAKWVGAEKVDGKYQFTEAQQEKFAEGFTSNLAEGRAPNPGLKPIYDFLNDKFMDAYAGMRRARVPLSKSITGVYDTLLLSHEQVLENEQASGLRAIPRPENVSQSEYAEYLADKASARTTASTAQVKEIMKESKDTQTAAFKEAYKKAYSDALVELGKRQEYIITDHVAAGKINTESLKAVTQDYAQVSNRYKTSADTGINAQFYMTAYELTPGQLVEILTTTPNKESVAAEIANESMTEYLSDKYGEVTDVDAKYAIRNYAMFRSLVKEEMMLAGEPLSNFNVYHNSLVESIEAKILTMPIKDVINMNRWLSREARTSELFGYAYSNGDMKKAAELRKQQAVINFMMIKAKEVGKKVNGFNKHYDKYRTYPTDENLKAMDGNSFDMITQMLKQFKFADRESRVPGAIGTRLQTWINERVNQGFTVASEIADQISFIAGGTEETSFSNVSVEQFTRLDSTVGVFEAIALREKEIKVGERTESNAKFRDSAIANMDKKKISPIQEKGLARLLKSTLAIEPVIERVFGEQVHNQIFAPFINSVVRRDNYRHQLNETFGKILKDNKIHRLDKKQMKDRAGVQMTDLELFVFLMNSGNSHNLDNFVMTLEQKQRGQNIDAMAVLEQTTPEMRQAANAIWAEMENVKKLTDAETFRATGKVVKAIEVTPYTFSDGTQMTGGYYPSEKVGRLSETNPAVDMFKSTDLFPEYTISKDRTLAVTGELDTTLNRLGSYIYKAANLATLQTEYNNVVNFMKDPQLQARAGEYFIGQIASWQQQAVMPIQGLGHTLALVDRASSVGILGFVPFKALIQMLGVIPATTVVKPTLVAKHTLKYANVTNFLTLPRDASSRSEYMKSRYANAAETIGGMMKDDSVIKSWGDKAYNTTLDWGMKFVAYGDMFASVVTWDAAYEQATLMGMENHNDRVLYADSKVRIAQGDAASYSKPAILAGQLRILNKFLTYFYAMHSMLVSRVMANEYGAALATGVMVGLVSPYIEAMVRSAFPNDDDDDDLFSDAYWDKVNERYKTDAAQAIGGMIFPWMGVGPAAAEYGIEGRQPKGEILPLTWAYNTATLGVDLLHVPFEDGYEREERIEKIQDKFLNVISMSPRTKKTLREIIIGD